MRLLGLASYWEAASWGRAEVGVTFPNSAKKQGQVVTRDRGKGACPQKEGGTTVLVSLALKIDGSPALFTGEKAGLAT